MRILAGIVIALVAMAVVTFALSIAPWFIFGVDSVLEPGRYDSIAIYDVYAVAIAFGGALLGGWLASTIGRSRIAVYIVVLFGAIGGVVNVLQHAQKADPGARPPGVSVMDAVQARKEPAWFTWMIPIVGVPGILIGGRASVRR